MIYSEKQISDTAKVLALALLIIGYFSENELFYLIAAAVLITNLLVPRLFYPLTVVWFILAKFSGLISSTILLSFIYFVFVFPVGLIRKIFSKDNLLINDFKKSRNSVFKSRDYLLSKEDLLHPY